MFFFLIETVLTILHRKITFFINNLIFIKLLKYCLLICYFKMQYNIKQYNVHNNSNNNKRKPL